MQHDRVTRLRPDKSGLRRDNFQAKTGWLTGWIVPFNTDKRDMVLRYFMETLQ